MHSSSGSTSKASRNKTKLKTVKLDATSEPPNKKLRTLPVFDLTGSVSRPPPQEHPVSSQRLSLLQSQTQKKDVKGKGKPGLPPVHKDDDRLWVDKYEPTIEADLAVHKRKVEDVRRWLSEAFEGGPTGKLRKYRRILVLTGPAGTAKTTTVRVLAREMGFEIVEWRNSMSERGPSAFIEDSKDFGDDSWMDTEALFDKFQAFLKRASACHSIFTSNSAAASTQSQSRSGEFKFVTQPSTQSLPSTSSSQASNRHLILLEDLPNILHLPTQVRFHEALQSLCGSSESGTPVVIVISDSGLRGENAYNDDAWDGAGGSRWSKKETIDIRNLLGPDLSISPYVTRIAFNPIAPTLMTKALQAMLTNHFASASGKPPAKDVVEMIVESSNGDIRSAVMALEFSCVVTLAKSGGKGKTRRNTARSGGARAVLEAVTRREQSLVLFHLMGKILYNKRKGDPPATHLSAKDAAKERELDETLLDPSPLPDWLSEHDRKASRVCLETIASDSPIDSSLLGLYVHQNYTMFCTDVDQCAGVCDGLSWVDWVGGHLPSNTPYAFPTLALSTLHALPTPVPRKGQKVCKPSWFDVRNKEQDALEGVGDVATWLGHGGASDERAPGRWTHGDIAVELSGWLRAIDRPGGAQLPVPRAHRLFSCLPWGVGSVGGDVLGEDEYGEVDDGEGEGDIRILGAVRDQEEGKGWWLENDDIEEAE
ncbi:Rad17 cell cycle checkpoint protein-domain-containing protein [Suillus clintonianus]|uniref:Rad17 cell cycle checkpoint protein-domain-containing protein n=1 Tax=Suillus clintonianus TaxID=1904413 RepID=UPI001B862695|nr:Rad17 cell cycle checkpoint protein-domain-containing protein [Suillus clintonianus]KAG2142475.1 Rad17 cell cycle checkpoint protein-domain-containing protein [Suillus clintonianus]